MSLRSVLREPLDHASRLFVKRSALAGAIRIAGLLCVFVLQILLARFIGDTVEYGKYAWGQSLLFMVGAVAPLGIPVVTGRFIAALSAQGNESAADAVIRRACLLLLGSSSVLIICAGILFLVQEKNASNYFPLAMVALFFAPAVSFGMLYRDMARARQWLLMGLLPLQVVRPIATGVLCFLAWGFCGGEMGGEAALMLAGMSVLVVVGLQAIAYHHRQSRLTRSGVAASAGNREYAPGELLRTALPLFVTRCAAMVMQYSSILLLGLLVGPSAAGAYFAAERLAQLASIPRAVISSVNQQSMAAAHAMGDIAKLRQTTAHSVHGGFWPSLAAVLVLVIFAEDLLSLFGNEFVEALPVLMILAVTNLVSVFMGPAQDLLVMTGQQKVIPKVMIVSAAIHVAVLILLISPLGAVGAALASTFSSVVSSVWLLRLARVEVGIGTTILDRWRMR